MAGLSTLVFRPNSESSPDFLVPLSKSICNRWLILQAVFPDLISPILLADADDSRILYRALHTEEKVIDVGAAGTAMRFATAYFASKEGTDIELRGSERMHQRPIGDLVDALRTLGAQIEYLGKTGFPPLHIRGRQLRGGLVSIRADLSSQFISALMLVAPTMQEDLVLHPEGRWVSQPYVGLTADVLRKAGIHCEMDDEIRVSATEPVKISPKIEGDWSSVAPALGWVALSGQSLAICGLNPHSVQGDAALMDFFPYFGIRPVWQDDRLKLSRENVPLQDFEFNLNAFPDLAQSLMLAALGQGRNGRITGLETLRIKETDRIAALEETARAFGAQVKSGSDWIEWQIDDLLQPQRVLHTYNDHRMAMAIAPLASKFPLKMDHPEVVNKSFPCFWEEMAKVGVGILDETSSG